MQKYFDDVFYLDTDNNPVPVSGATITVYLTGTTTPADIYSDNGVTPKSNPFTNNSDGSFDFYAEDGRYDVLVYKSPFKPYTIRDILLDGTEAAGTSDHGALSGLSDDDHEQYLLASGSRAASEICLTPKESSSGPEGTIFYHSTSKRVYVGVDT